MSDRVCSPNQHKGGSNPGTIPGRFPVAPDPQRAADMHIFADPLRKGCQQALLSVTLICEVCDKDLSPNRCPGLIDLETGKAYCGGDHWERRKQVRRG